MKAIMKTIGALLLVFLLVASVPVFARPANERDIIKKAEVNKIARVTGDLTANVVNGNGNSLNSWQTQGTGTLMNSLRQQAIGWMKSLSVLYSSQLFNFQSLISSKIVELKNAGVSPQDIAYFAGEAQKVETTLNSAQNNYMIGWLYFKPKSFAQPDYSVAVSYFVKASNDYNLFKQELISLAQLFNQLKNGQ